MVPQRILGGKNFHEMRRGIYVQDMRLTTHGQSMQDLTHVDNPRDNPRENPQE